MLTGPAISRFNLYSEPPTAPDRDEAGARVRVPATAGELWQGYLHERLVMINSPIDFFGEASVHCTSEIGEVSGAPDSPLVRAAARLVLETLDEARGLHVEINRRVPRGLGMASSTTELAATAFAAARALGQSEREARRLAHGVVCELDSGNDGNYLEGLNLVDPRQNDVILSFTKVPSLRLLLVNTGGELSTHAMDREREKAVCRRENERLQKSFEKMLRGLTFHDLKLIGEAATESALVYQEITHKPHLREVIRLCAEFADVLGVTVGHSGTVIGVLARPEGGGLPRLAAEMHGIFGMGHVIGEFNLVSGGFYERRSL